MKDFEIACGSMIGYDHFAFNKNNQDAFKVLCGEEVIAAIICDGCGSKSAKHSEVGAKIGACLIPETLVRIIKRYFKDLAALSLSKKMYFYPELLEKSLQDTLAQLRVLANSMGESLSQIINEYFLFTVVGVIITSYETIVFSLGDGVIILNEEFIPLGPFPENEPPYLAYNITGSDLKFNSPELLKFRLHRVIPTEEFSSLLIGSDGLHHFISAAKRNLPGKDEALGIVNQFWEEDKYFRNPDMVRRKLFLANRDVMRYLRDKDGHIIDIQQENGLLPDDTTLIAIRRRKAINPL